jgi:hypothetical protein
MIQIQKMVKLADVCDISAGYTARSGLEVSVEGGLIVVQLGDVRDGRPVAPCALRRFQLEGLSCRFMARPGDVLFRSKGTPNTASIVATGFKETIAAFQPLMILRPKVDKIVPEYLVWAINRQKAQRYFSASAQGTTIQSVSKATLEALAVPLPSLDDQRRIGAAYHLSMREADLLRELASKSEFLAARSLDNLTIENGVSK